MCRDKSFFPTSVRTSNILFIAILSGDASGLEITQLQHNFSVQIYNKPILRKQKYAK